MIELIEAAKEGLTLIYGPPGAGKTSIALRIADRLANRILWVSTTEGPKYLGAAAKRVGANPEKFAFLDFPRAFREDILRYVTEHVNEYDLLVVDSVNGLSAAVPSLEKAVHSVLYQISHDKPVILVSEEEPLKLHYIADNVVHVWYKKNSIGHIIRYVQLEKSRRMPPSPRYIFEILDGKIAYLYFSSGMHTGRFVELEELGIKVPAKSVICITSSKTTKVLELLNRIKNEALLLKLGPWEAYTGLELKEGQEYQAKTFHDLFKLLDLIASRKITTKYLVVSGLLNLKDREVLDYVFYISACLNYVDYVAISEIGAPDETKRIQKFCTENIFVD